MEEPASASIPKRQRPYEREVREMAKAKKAKKTKSPKKAKAK
jgi:hypothetical protein